MNKTPLPAVMFRLMSACGASALCHTPQSIIRHTGLLQDERLSKDIRKMRISHEYLGKSKDISKDKSDEKRKCV